MPGSNHPQLGFVSRLTLNVPAGGYAQLPRPFFPPRYSHVRVLYQFAGDNTQKLELVTDDASTAGSTINASTEYNYGGTDIPFYAEGFFKYLYNSTGVATSVTVVTTRLA